MKILIISNLFPPYTLGGYEILCGQISHELTRRGHEVVVLTSRHGVEEGPDHEPMVRVCRELNLYQPFDQPPKLMRKRRWRVGKENYRTTQSIIARTHPDVVFIWSQLRLTLGAARAAQDSGIPVAYTFNDEHIAGYLPAHFGLNPRSLARYAADHWIFPGITLDGLSLKYVTCISHRLKENLLARGVRLNGVRVIYQGIVIEQFPVKPDIGAIHAPPRVLYVGQLHPYKGVHTLIRAAHRIVAGERPNENAEAPRLTVCIVGDGPEAYKQQLQEEAAQGDATIELVGKMPHAELPHIYREHDIFVFPSIWQEPFGLTHLEAMASGTTVISTADGGHGEFLKHEENALVFEKENTEQLAAHLVRIINDPELSRRLATNARMLVKTEFTLDRYVTELETFLLSTIDRHAQPTATSGL